MTRQLSFAAAFCLLVSFAAGQVTLTVPGQFATPELAVIAASSGDTVLVSPGTYSVVLDYFGKAVNVVSTDGPSMTTLTPSTTFIAPVCFINQENPNAILDGFTVTGSSTASNGGGINVGFNASPIIRNCIISANSTFAGGGGIACAAGSTATIVNTIFFANSSQSGQGGAVYCGPLSGALPAASISMLNCTITANSAVTGQPATDTGGVFCAPGATCSLDGCIVWSNTDRELNNNSQFTINYSIIDGGNGAGGPFPGAQNLDVNPNFANAAGGDFNLTLGSPAVDSGNPSAMLPATDCTGSPRVINFRVDRGAEELFDIFPGSGEDLAVQTAVNGTPDGNPVKSATSADAYVVRMLSPGGTYDGTIPILMAQAFPTGTSPAPFAMFPELHIDIFMPILALYNGTSQPPFGFGLLPAGGLTFAYTVPAGQVGMSVQIQGLVLSPNPNNAFFTASTSHRLRIL